MRRPIIIFAAVLVTISGCVTNPSAEALTILQAANEAFNEKQFETAESGYLRFLETDSRLGIYRNPDLEKEALEKLTVLYETRGDYGKALHYLEAIDAYYAGDNGPGTPEAAERLLRRGKLHGYTGDFTAQKTVLERAYNAGGKLANSPKKQDRLIFAETAAEYAEALYQTGEIDRAVRLASEAYGIQKTNGDIERLIRTSFQLGNYSLDAGRLEEARNFLRESAGYAGERNLNTAEQYNGLGKTAYLEGDYQHALEYTRTALENAEGSKNPGLITQVSISLGDIYRVFNDTAEAEKHYRSALEALGSVETKAIRASLLVRLGVLGLGKNDGAAALKFFDEARNLYLQAGSRLGVAVASLRKGEALIALEKYDDAEAELSTGFDVFLEQKKPNGAALSMLFLSHAALETGKGDLAEARLKRALSLEPVAEILWQILYRYSILAEKNRDFATAALYLSRSIDTIETLRESLKIDDFRTQYLYDKLDVYDLLIRVLLKSGNITEAWSVSERARARTFLDMISSHRFPLKPSLDTPTVRRERELKIRIEQLQHDLFSADQERTALTVELDSAKREYQAVLERLKTESPQYDELVSIRPPSPEELRRILPRDTVLVEYWVSGDETYAWVITDESFSVRSLGVGEAALSAQVKTVRRLIQQIQPGAFDALKAAYGTLIEPLGLEKPGRERIIFVPHGSLHYLPFNALMKGDGYLIERYSVRNEPSASVLYALDRREPSKTGAFLGMALGNLELGGNPPLPFTRNEVEALSRMFRDTTAEYEAGASETFFKRAAGNSSIIHLATHGLFDPSFPAFSAILFNPTAEDDGLLNVHEVLGLDLDCDLITLSACNSGLGTLSKGDEIAGLSRAFIFAGTRALVSSLWSVSDEYTALLMEEFYRGSAAGLSTDRALQNAQKAVLGKQLAGTGRRGLTVQGNRQEPPINEGIQENREKVHPFFWAPFFMTGDSQ